MFGIVWAVCLYIYILVVGCICLGFVLDVLDCLGFVGFCCDVLGFVAGFVWAL